MVLFRALAVYAPIPLPSLPNALWQSALLSFTQASGSSVPRVPSGQATTGLPEMSRCHPKSITACSKQSAFTSGGSELTCTSLIACEILSCFEHILVLSKGSIQQGHQGVNNTRPGKRCQMEMLLLLSWWRQNRVDGPAIFRAGVESFTDPPAGLQQGCL